MLDISLDKLNNNCKVIPDAQHDLTNDELKCVIDFIENKSQMNEKYKLFLKMRWLKAVLHLEHESEKNKKWHDRFSVIVILSSAIIASLSGANLAGTAKLFPMNMAIDTFLGKITILSCVGKEFIFPGILFILGLIVTIIVGLMNQFKFDEVRWKKRIYAEKLKQEGFEFLQLIGKYKPENICEYKPDNAGIYYDRAYPQFAEKVEQLINEINEGYTNLFGGGQRKDEGQQASKGQK